MMALDAKSPAAAPLHDGTTDYVPMRKKYNCNQPHITELPITWGNWYKHVNWLNCFFILFIPFLGCLGAYWTPLQLYTGIFAVVYYFNAGLGITAGMIDFLTASAPPLSD